MRLARRARIGLIDRVARYYGRRVEDWMGEQHIVRSRRGRHMTEANARLPVPVLSGFLGSGKTTLLKSPLLADSAVLINEFGEIGIDHRLVEAGADTTVAFGVWLTLLLHAHGTAVPRVKGLLNVRGVDVPVAINGVQYVVHPPFHLPVSGPMGIGVHAQSAPRALGPVLPLRNSGRRIPGLELVADRFQGHEPHAVMPPHHPAAADTPHAGRRRMCGRHRAA